jgi:hypothetical protein
LSLNQLNLRKSANHGAIFASIQAGDHRREDRQKTTKNPGRNTPEMSDEVEIMLVMNLFGEYDYGEEFLQDEPEYPDEVLEAEWNPVLEEVHSRIVSEKKVEDSESEA